MERPKREAVASLERLIEIDRIMGKWEETQPTDETSLLAMEEEIASLQIERKLLREQLIVDWGYADRTGRFSVSPAPNIPLEEDGWMCELCFTNNNPSLTRCDTCGVPRREGRPLSADHRHREISVRDSKRCHHFEPHFFPRPVFCRFCQTFIREPTGKQGFICTNEDCDFRAHAKCLKRAQHLECVPSLKKPMEVPLKFVPPLADKEGSVLLPVILDGLAVHSLGRIPESNTANFHDTNHLFPVGFRSTRVFASVTDPSSECLYTSEILSDRDQAPRFSVTPADDPQNPEIATSPAAAWMKIVKRVQMKRDGGMRTGVLKAVSGPEYFGLAHPTVMKLLQDLPNVDKCVATGYVMHKFVLATDELLDEADRKFVALLTGPNLRIVKHLWGIMEGGLEFGDMCQAMIDIFQYYGQDLRLILFILEKEIEKCHNVAILFRGHTMGAKLVSVYMQRHGNAYLRAVLKPIIDEIHHGDKSMEVDPHKFAGDDNLQTNRQNLVRAVKQIFSVILERHDLVPACLRKLCFFTQEEVTKKFPMMAGNLAIVGGFFFLRFVCPVLVAPHAYGLADDVLPEHIGRALILITKVLQNMSNGVIFEKELYMKFVNPFIQENQARMTSFLAQLCVVPLTEQDDALAQDTPVAAADFRASVKFLKGFCQERNIPLVDDPIDEKVVSFEHVESRQRPD